MSEGSGDGRRFLRQHKHELFSEEDDLDSRRSFLKKLGIIGISGAAVALGLRKEWFSARAQESDTYNVKDYDAAGDGSTDDTEAIIAAANDAAPDGTVYFPSGTYLIGSNSQHPLDYPDDGSWNNLTWEGENYAETEIRMAEGHDRYHSMFRLQPDSNIEGATFRQLQMNGNQHEQNGRPGMCIKTDAGSPSINGKVTVENCLFRNAVSGGVIAEAGTWEMRNCGFRNIGERDHELVGSASHALSVFCPEFLIEKSCFDGIWGVDVDISTDGVSGHDVTIRECVSIGSQEVWDGFLKQNPGTEICRIENTRIKNHSKIIIKSNPKDTSIGRLELQDVLIDGGTWTGIDFPAPGTVECDNVAIKNVNEENKRGGGFYVNGAGLGDSGQISIHNVGSNNSEPALLFQNSSGSIDEVVYGGTSPPSNWETDGVNIGNITNGDPLIPDVPEKSEVGPGSGSSGVDGSQDAGDTSDTNNENTGSATLTISSSNGEPTNYLIETNGDIAGPGEELVGASVSTGGSDSGDSGGDSGGSNDGGGSDGGSGDLSNSCDYNIPDDAINVQDYGAVGDGQTDDSDAIEQAINDASEGDTVYLPAPDDFYAVRGQNRIIHIGEDVADNVTIVGDGENTVIKFMGGNGGNNFTVMRVSKPIIGLEVKNLVFDGGSENVEGQKVTAAGAFGINLDYDGEKSYLIENCVFKNAKKSGLIVTADNSTVRNVTAYDNGLHGIGAGFDGTSDNPIEIQNCYAYNNGWFTGTSKGIDASKGSIVVSDCVIEGNAQGTKVSDDGVIDVEYHRVRIQNNDSLSFQSTNSESGEVVFDKVVFGPGGLHVRASNNLNYVVPEGSEIVITGLESDRPGFQLHPDASLDAAGATIWSNNNAAEGLSSRSSQSGNVIGTYNHGENAGGPLKSTDNLQINEMNENIKEDIEEVPTADEVGAWANC